MKKTPLQRLVEKIHINETTECWEWTGCLTGAGYGQIGIQHPTKGYVSEYAHRVAYEWLVGPVPEGCELDHLCRVRKCINPFHLEAVPHIENVLRGAAPNIIRSLRLICKRGHPLRGDNVYISAKGLRSCIICRRECLKKFIRANPEYNKTYHGLRKRVGHLKRNHD
jgi:hypothetical protein